MSDNGSDIAAAPRAAAPVDAEPSSLRLVFTLAFAGTLAGSILALAFGLTQPAIARNRAAALRAAVFQVVPGATRLQQLVLRNAALVADDGPAADGTAVFAAFDDAGTFKGYAIPAAGMGFQDTVALIFGFDPARRRAIGMRVLESKETPGLGDKIVVDPHFVGEFDDLAVEPPIVVVKGGGSGRPNEVDGISGATISSKAVVRIVNRACAEWLVLLPSPATLAPPKARPEEVGR